MIIQQKPTKEENIMFPSYKTKKQNSSKYNSVNNDKSISEKTEFQSPKKEFSNEKVFQLMRKKTENSLHSKSNSLIKNISDSHKENDLKNEYEINSINMSNRKSYDLSEISRSNNIVNNQVDKSVHSRNSFTSSKNNINNLEMSNNINA